MVTLGIAYELQALWSPLDQINSQEQHLEKQVQLFWDARSLVPLPSGELLELIASYNLPSIYLTSSVMNQLRVHMRNSGNNVNRSGTNVNRGPKPTAVQWRGAKNSNQINAGSTQIDFNQNAGSTQLDFNQNAGSTQGSDPKRNTVRKPWPFHN
jgi:hypothetical protein